MNFNNLAVKRRDPGPGLDWPIPGSAPIMSLHVLLQVTTESINMNVRFSGVPVILALAGVICHAIALTPDERDVQQPKLQLRSVTNVVNEDHTLDDQFEKRLKDIQQERQYQPEVDQKRETDGSQELPGEADEFDYIERREQPNHNHNRADGKDYSRQLNLCAEPCYMGIWALQSTCKLVGGGTEACCIEDCTGKECTTGDTWWGIAAECKRY